MRRTLSAGLLIVAALVSPAAGEEGDVGQDAAREARLHALVVSRNWREMLRLADEYIAACEDCVVAWQFRAYALHQMGRPREAQVAYERAIALDPSNWWAHMNLGSLLSKEGRYEAAVRAATEAVRLQPTSRAAQARLSLIHCDRGNYEAAVAAVQTALEGGVDAAWAHAEMGYLTWAIGDLDASRSHWDEAREAGADEAACAHGRRLVRWDERARRGETEETARIRRDGPSWLITVGRITVLTRIGPRLPREFERLLEDLQTEMGRFLGVEKAPPFVVRLHLARTREEHEANRRREFPAGPRGKAFHVDRRVWGGRRWQPSGAPPGGTLDMYVSWSEPGLERGLSHELAHALIRSRIPAASDVPAWLDEGISTYLELHADPKRRGRLRSGLVRTDLLEIVASARRDGTVPDFAAMLTVPRSRFYGTGARALYAQSWSMVHYLVEKRGRAKVRAYLDGLDGRRNTGGARDLTRAFGQDVATLTEGWEQHLRRLTPDRGDEESATR